MSWYPNIIGGVSHLFLSTCEGRLYPDHLCLVKDGWSIVRLQDCSANVYFSKILSAFLFYHIFLAPSEHVEVGLRFYNWNSIHLRASCKLSSEGKPYLHSFQDQRKIQHN